jgi:phosphopantetheinyl transferase (holo-ACP synthase)
MIGNDIVDLRLAKTQSNWQRSGFLEKQFTKEEQVEIKQSENAFLTVWLLWSMKEAAYKCVVQKQQKRFFNPKKFQCFLTGTKRGTVVFGTERYQTKSSISKDSIHTIATKENRGEVTSEFFVVDKQSFQSNITNNKLLSFFGENVALLKNAVGVPYLYKNNTKLAVSFSTSHHGSYGGFAILHEDEFKKRTFQTLRKLRESTFTNC